MLTQRRRLIARVLAAACAGPVGACSDDSSIEDAQPQSAAQVQAPTLAPAQTAALAQSDGELLYCAEPPQPASMYFDAQESGGERREMHHGLPIHIVYLAMDGITLTCGGENAVINESSIACSTGTDWPPFPAAAFGCGSLQDCKEAVVAMMQDFFADYNFLFVTERPGTGPYEMVVVSGQGGGALGLAPLDCNDAQGANVSFAFADSIAASGGCAFDYLRTTIAQELSHALGLCHNSEAASYMYPSVAGCDQNVDTCGMNIDGCTCEGLNYDPYCPSDLLGSVIGPAVEDVVPPLAEIISPQSGQTVPSSFTAIVEAQDDLAVWEMDLTLDDQSFGVHGVLAAEVVNEWPLSDVSNGNHRICVSAVDAFENESIPNCVEITVGNVDCISGEDCCGPDCCTPLPNCENRGGTGDGCALDEDCRSQICVAPFGDETQTHCTHACTPGGCLQDDECPAGFSCSPGAGDWVCQKFAVSRDIGWPCHTPSGCASGLCVGREDDLYCTSSCDPSDGQSCPTDYACNEVSGENVCVRQCPDEPVRGGCSIGGAGDALSYMPLAGLMLLGCLLRRRPSVATKQKAKR